MAEDGLNTAARPDVADTIIDHRRPGRIDHINPALIPLLRDPTRGDQAIDDSILELEPADDLAPTRGILLGALLSVPIWVLVIGMVILHYCERSFLFG